jgi:hypothetical protein
MSFARKQEDTKGAQDTVAGRTIAELVIRGCTRAYSHIRATVALDTCGVA